MMSASLLRRLKQHRAKHTPHYPRQPFPPYSPPVSRRVPPCCSGPSNQVIGYFHPVQSTGSLPTFPFHCHAAVNKRKPLLMSFSERPKTTTLAAGKTVPSRTAYTLRIYIQRKYFVPFNFVSSHPPPAPSSCPAAPPELEKTS